MTNPNERFWSYVRKTKNCWNWIGGINSVGYGIFWINGQSIGAHRYSLLSKYKPHGKKQWALHKCDNKKCVNPDHLYWGDHSDNTTDAVKRNRMATGKRHGSHTKPLSRATFLKNGHSKLSKQDVLDINQLVNDGVHKKIIAKKYEICLVTVYKAIQRAKALIEALNKEGK